MKQTLSKSEALINLKLWAPILCRTNVFKPRETTIPNTIYSNPIRCMHVCCDILTLIPYHHEVISQNKQNQHIPNRIVQGQEFYLVIKWTPNLLKLFTFIDGIIEINHVKFHNGWERFSSASNLSNSKHF